MISLAPHIYSLPLILSLSAHYRSGCRASESLGNLPKITQLVRIGPRLQSSSSESHCLPSPCLNVFSCMGPRDTLAIAFPGIRLPRHSSWGSEFLSLRCSNALPKGYVRNFSVCVPRAETKPPPGGYCPERQEPPTPTDVMNQAVGGSYLECYLSMAEGFQKPKAIVWLASKGMMGIGR